ncbi:replicative DNA helicase [Mycoplasmopsis hyopharyngis]|uniref:replicative DNA helicase n=1 Tax=Mycoplasmopsis hyopharyngis TaxID=29558 RepID=UPI00387381BF
MSIIKNNETFSNSNNTATTHKSLEDEQAILSIVLMQNSYIDYVQNYLLEEDFYYYENRELFKIFKEIVDENETINEYHILTKAKSKNLQNINPSFLAFLYAKPGFTSSIDSYIKNLVRLTGLRKIEKKLHKIINDMNVNQDLSDQSVIGELNELINEGYRSSINKDFEKASDVAAEYIKELEERRKSNLKLKGIPTGYDDLDHMTQGLNKGEVIILAARPAMGKTAFALNIAANVARKSYRVVFFSLEMNSKDLISRILCSVTKIDGSKLKEATTLSEAELYKIQGPGKKIIEDMNLFIDDSSNNDIDDIKWKCRRLHKIQPIDLIVIDYLQLLSIKNNRGDNRQNEVAKISRNIKVLARELNIPIIALSQLSRSVEQREDKRPIMSDLRESGGIENDADIIAFLYRPSYYKRKNNEEEMKYGEEFGSPTFVILAKHRNGPSGTVPLLFRMNCSLFTSIPEEWKNSIKNTGLDNKDGNESI